MPKLKGLPIKDSSSGEIQNDHANERRDASRPPMLFTREYPTSWENMIHRYNLQKRAGFWTGSCPDCRYPKPTLWAKPIGARVAVGCFACDGATSITWATVNSGETLVTFSEADNILRALSYRARRALLRGSSRTES